MARRNGDGDSKQGLTIALVLFVLVSIILGLMAYFGYAEARGSDDEIKKLRADVTSLKDQLGEAQLKSAIVTIASGLGNAKEEKDDLLAMHSLKKANKKLGELYDTERQKIVKKGVEWDDFAERPKATISARLQELENNIKAAEKVSTDGRVAMEKATKDYQREIAAMREVKAKAEAELADTKNVVEKRIKGIDENYKKTVEKFEENIIAAEKWAAEKAALQKQMQEVEAKLQAALKDAELKVKKLEEKIPQVDLLAYDKPKGKITRIDAASQTAYINLGTADLVRPGLTFSIFGVGQYRANAERKASVEVINVVGDHLASARVTEVRNSARDPILTGDELYNPAWSPGLREHVAIAGVIDLTGDGRDGTLEFVRNLDKQGVAVDAYLDTRDMAVKGKGISRQTGYLVLGEVLEFQQQERIREGDVRQERKMSINAEVAKMREDAIRHGVTIVPARRFMALMGFKMPRVAATLDDWNAYLLKKPAMDAKAAEKGGEMKKGDDMKKGEDMKKGDDKKADDKKDAK